ncbi:MAG: OsmC family protein [Bacteroidota bacterium]
MVQINIEYLGDLHCTVQHGPTGQTFTTDAPVDNQGKGEFISPTDLAASAVGSCIATIMGTLARTHNIDIDGMKVTVLKEMTNVPYRRIKKLSIDFLFPHKLSEKEFTLMRNVIKTCPVTRSMHPDVEIEPVYRFAE